MATEPNFDGTEDIAPNWADGEWERPDLSDFPSVGEEETWNDLDAGERADIADNFIEGTADADTYGDLGYPVVNPETGNLNRNGVRAALSRAAAEGDSEVESIARDLWEEHFSEEEESDRDAPDVLERAEEMVGDVVEQVHSGVVERAANSGEDPIVMRFNKGSTTDAHGTRFDMSGADLERFRKNPVVRWAHGKDETVGRMPIGKADVDIHGDSLVARVEFDPNDEKAQKIERKVRNGFINGGSVFAKPTAPPEMRSVGDEEVVAFPKWELRALSVVGIPSNPDALAMQRSEEAERMHYGERSGHFDRACRGLMCAEAARRVRDSDMQMAQAKQAVKDEIDREVPGGLSEIKGMGHPFADFPNPMVGFQSLASVLSVEPQTLITLAEADGAMYDMDRSTGRALTREEATAAAASAVQRYLETQIARRREQEEQVRDIIKKELGRK